MSSTPLSDGRQRPQGEITLPDGKKVIVVAKTALDSARQTHANRDDVADFVVQGSPEHTKYLHEARKHHEGRRAQLRERHGAAFEEWERNQQDLNSVSVQLSRMSTNSSGLHGNYGKFGFDSGVQTYDDGEEIEGEERKGYRQDSTMKIARRPVVRQWFHRNMLWRASEQTEIMAIELFFDLLYGKWQSSSLHVWFVANHPLQSVSFIAMASICPRSLLAMNCFDLPSPSSCRGKFGPISRWLSVGFRLMI